MKLLVADSKKISYYTLPKVVEDYFMIDYIYDDTHETLTLVAKEGKWYLSSDTNVQIVEGEQITKEVNLTEYLYYKIHLVDINIDAMIFLMPDIIDYNEISIKQITGITIGSNPNCNISYNNELTLLNHAQIVNNKSNYILTDSNDEKGPVYINSKRVHTHVLNLGDVIFINGIIMICLKITHNII